MTNTFTKASRLILKLHSHKSLVSSEGFFRVSIFTTKPTSSLRFIHSVNAEFPRQFYTFPSRNLVQPHIMPPEKQFQRLPKTVVPKHYDITLKPDLENFDILGKVNVKVDVRNATQEIVLNAADMEITSVVYTPDKDDGSECTPSSIKLDQEMETVTLSFDSPLPEAQGNLLLKFKAELNDKMKGFYRSKYTTSEGEVRYAAVTQFESTDARRAFPCWDEPAIKSTFDVTLVVPKDRVALSNTDVISVSDYISETDDHASGDTSYHCVKFGTTPVMSTYLVACVVGEYDYVEGVSEDGVKVRVYTPVGKKEQGQFALEVAVKVLPFYKEYFNIAYPLPKLDLIAIQDFAAGAMENWGLVTYRENCLLVDPKNTSSSRKQWIALVISHEIAHQWFGNFVTMEWWTHLWLNEGFATWIEFLCVDLLFPNYKIWTQFVTDTLIRALELDALKNSHPIEVPVGHPSEVDEIFDDISYSKGASVIRMLHSFIGDKDFRKGMNHYLIKHQYSNTFTEDLWASLEHASGKPIGEIMSTWTKQMGFPLIKVSARQEGTSRILTLIQEKFCADPADLNGDTSRWMVPIGISTARDPSTATEKFLLDSKSAEVTIEHVRPDDWVKINPDTVGYYRVQYPSEMIDLFLPAIQNQTLPPLDRLGLLDDVFALVQSGQTSSVEALKLMQAFVNEENYTVWNSINNCIGKLSVLLSHSEHLPAFQEYGRRLFSTVAGKMGWEPVEGESHMDVLLRSLVINRMGALEDEATINEAKRRLESHVNGSCILPADLRSPVYRCALRKGDERTLETMLKLYRENDLHEEKDRILRSLGCLPDKSLLQKVLDFTMTDEVRSQDKVFGMASVAVNRRGRDLAWAFFKKNIDSLSEIYKGALMCILIKNVTENFVSEEAAAEVEAFFREHPIPSAERTVQQSVESILLNAKWFLHDHEAIGTWLSSQ